MLKETFISGYQKHGLETQVTMLTSCCLTWQMLVLKILPNLTTIIIQEESCGCRLSFAQLAVRWCLESVKCVCGEDGEKTHFLAYMFESYTKKDEKYKT